MDEHVEPKEDWGSLGSRFDRDGFVKPEETEEERLGGFVAQVVDARSDGRHTAELEEEFRSAVEKQERFRLEVATTQDAEDLEGSNPSDYPSRSIRGNSHRAEAFHQDEVRGNLYAIYADKEAGRSLAGQVHEFLELNKEGLSSLTVEVFVGLMTTADLLGREIKEANGFIESGDALGDTIQGKVDRREPAVVLPPKEASYHGMTDVTEGVHRQAIKAYEAGLYTVDEVNGEILTPLSALAGDIFDMAPKEFLAKHAGLARTIEEKIRTGLAQREQALAEFHERIKSGDFMSDLINESENKEQQAV